MAAAGIAGLLRAQGEAITITPKNGADANMTAIVETERSRIVADGRGQTTKRTRKILITKDPAGEFGGMADPQENAVVLYGTTEYAVSSRQDAGSYWELECDFVGRKDRTRPGLRQKD